MNPATYNGLMDSLSTLIYLIALGCIAAVLIALYPKLVIWCEKRAIKKRKLWERRVLKDLQRASGHTERNCFREFRS